MKSEKKLRAIAVFAICMICIIVWLLIKSKDESVITGPDTERHVRTEFLRPSVISLSPAFTESVYMLGAGSNLVGVTDSCKFPHEASSICSVGPAMRPDIKKILDLAPDYVIAGAGQETLCAELRKKNIKTLLCGSSSLDAICTTIWNIADIFGAYDKAEMWISNLDLSLKTINLRRNEIQTVPRVLVCVAREKKKVEKAFFSGPGLFYSDVISAAGGTNAYTGDIVCPELDKSKICEIDPDIIFDIIPGDENGFATEEIKTFYDQWSDLKIRKNGSERKIKIISGSWAAVPGPRVIRLLDSFADTILTQ